MCTSVCPGSLIYQDSEKKKAFINILRTAGAVPHASRNVILALLLLYLGADIGGMGSLMTVKSTPDTLTWDIKKRDGSKEEILINKKESNKY